MVVVRAQKGESDTHVVADGLQTVRQGGREQVLHDNLQTHTHTQGPSQASCQWSCQTRQSSVRLSCGRVLKSVSSSDLAGVELVVDARRVHRVLHVKAKVERVQERLMHAVARAASR